MLVETSKVCKRTGKSYIEIREILRRKKATKVSRGVYEVDNLSCLGELTARILCSDWHIGKGYKLSYSDYIYNKDVAQRRVWEFTDKTVKLLHDIKIGIKNIVVHILGDMCEGAGEVYPGQYWYLDIPNASDQAKCAADMITEMCERLEMEFNVPVYIKMVAGNHEITKHDHKDNNLAYHTFQLINWGDKEFSSDYVIDDIGGYRCYSSHGHKFSRAIQRRRNQMLSKKVVFGANLVVAGHQHRPDGFRGCDNFAGFLNGSLAGYDTFAQKMAFDPAMVCQTVILTHPDDSNGFIWGEHTINVK